MPSPHAPAAAVDPASGTPLPATSVNYRLNSSVSISNLTTNNTISSPTSRSTTALSSQISTASKKLPYQPYGDSSLTVSRAPYAPSSHHGPNGPSHYANNASHISSAVNIQSSQSFFSPASLPRTSSLLPPPKITVDQKTSKQPTLYDPFNGPAVRSNFADPVNERSPDESISPKSIRRPSPKTHSRSSSLGGLSEGFRNLNRWSISTSSSRASNASPQKSKRFSRRLSVDSTAFFSQASPAISPRTRLLRGRSSTAGSSPEERRPAVPPLTTLPPIATLPSLEHEDYERAAVSGQDARPERTPYFQGPAVENDTVRYWDDSTTGPVEPSYSSISERATPDSTLPTSSFSRDATMPHTENADSYRERGHSRNRSQPLKGSTDTTSSSQKRSKQPSQKVMLSKALQKANTAVQLDNAQNFEGARSAYREACELLHQVLLRTAGDEDKRKLEAIRKTYSSRIEELDQLLPDESKDSKALPQRPASNDTASTYRNNDHAANGASINGNGRTNSDMDRVQQTQQYARNYARPSSAARRTMVPRDSSNAASEAPRYTAPTPTGYSEPHRSQSAFSQYSPRRDRLVQQDVFSGRPMEDEYMPPPLSPRRPVSPRNKQSGRATPDLPIRSDFSMQTNRLAPDTCARSHERVNSHESISWLDPIDESGGSAASSVHSRSSSMGIRRKHIRAASGNTEAEFDAALDDAIEAAYDDGYEPAVYMEENTRVDGVAHEDDVVAQALRKVKLAKERVRQSELEVRRLDDDRERRMRALQEDEQTIPEGFYDGNDSDDDERILEEMTRGYAIEDFTLVGGKPRVPRESDSSEFTSRTWHSSTVSNPPTANTVLSTVSENMTMPPLSKSQTPIAPPPTQSLPKLPSQPPSSAGRDSVRDRRLSGQNARQLKIETQALANQPKIAEPATAGPTVSNADFSHVQQPKTAGFIVQQRQALSAVPTRSAPSLRGPSSLPSGVVVDGAPPTPPVPPVVQDAENQAGSPSATKPPGPSLRKNFSSNSLKSVKSRNLSVSNIDEYPDLSPGTPLSNQFSHAAARLPALPSLPTPVATSFRERMTTGYTSGGYYLFDSDIHSPSSSGELNAVTEDVPAPLEPCPTDVMLRPFWLMRALYQTLAHPRGGYLSNKLFVPRDVWRVKGVKIKNLEEKIGQCDLLTAALQKLGRVNSEDADAVLEEMQSLEGVLEQVQSFLSRRLGNEVGVQSSSSMFKDADTTIDGSAEPKMVPRNNSVSGKSAFSWRRLRSKTSSTGMGSAYERGGSRKESNGTNGTEGVSLPTLPMTNHPTSKPSKRDLSGVQFGGPNANYMAALARLFDAAQTIDQIARQVEDPGLRHADKTQVGLELCTRHAAEFFGFYICRFVLQDLTIMLDKFIKRGSEWVLV